MRTKHARTIRAGIAAARLEPHWRDLWLATRSEPLAIRAFMRTRVSDTRREKRGDR